MKPLVLTYDEFCVRNGVPSTAPSEAGMPTLGHMNPTAHRRAIKLINQRMAEWQNQRDKLRKEYTEAIRQGEIRKPTRKERLEATAKGNPDLESVQAARRLLARYV